MSLRLVLHCLNPRCRREVAVDPDGRGLCPHCGSSFRLSWEVEGPGEASRARLGPPHHPLPHQALPHQSPPAAAARETTDHIENDPTPLPDAVWAAISFDLSPAADPATANSLAAPAPRSGASPARLGRFQVRRFLGEGAFGRVYEGYDPQLDRPIALKVAKAEQLDGAGRVERFLREARAAANLRHPNIVPVFDAGREGDFYYIASAMLPGRTLGDLIASGMMSARRAAEVAAQLAEALAYAHARGVVHRDVKPANVLIDEAGAAVLADFGLALRRDEERLTQEGALLGTPQYMAPEQARGQYGTPLPASDQYSLGVLFYEMLTGRPPFQGPTAMLLHQQLESAPAAPRRINPDVPAGLERICLRCLEKAPGRRFPDCQNLARALRGWLEAGEGSGIRAAARSGEWPRADEPSLPWPSDTDGRRALFFFLDTGLWKAALVSSIFAAGLAVASWLQR